MWKICTKCKKHKALWAFDRRSKNDRALFSIRAQCSVCYSSTKKKYWEDNKEVLAEKNKKWREDNPEKFKKSGHTYRHSERGTLVREAWREKTNWPERRRELEKGETFSAKKRTYYHKNQKRTNGLCKKRMIMDAEYEGLASKLTIEEKPKLAKDGVSLKVKCKFCREYFIPIRRDVYSRIHCLNHTGYGEKHLYCSEECKLACPVFGNNSGMPSTSLREAIPQSLRDEVLQRNDGMCEMCGENPIEEIHHEKPASTHPHLQLDKENLWGFCIPCHYKIFHQLEGCTLPELRKKSVNNCSTTD